MHSLQEETLEKYPKDTSLMSFQTSAFITPHQVCWLSLRHFTTFSLVLHDRARSLALHRLRTLFDFTSHFQESSCCCLKKAALGSVRDGIILQKKAIVLKKSLRMCIHAIRTAHFDGWQSTAWFFYSLTQCMVKEQCTTLGGKKTLNNWRELSSKIAINGIAEASFSNLWSPPFSVSGYCTK